MIGKVLRTVRSQYRERGLLSTLAMNLSHFTGFLRGLFYKLLYFGSISYAPFSMQGNSTIEIFNRKSRLKLGSFVFIRKNVSIRLDHGGELTLGNKTFINDNCTINCVHRIAIGDYVKIAPNVCINDHDHNYKPNSDSPLIQDEVIIGSHVWIGANTVILRGTVIGDHSVIAAGSVVKGTVPPYTLFLNKRENSLKEITGANVFAMTPAASGGPS